MKKVIIIFAILMVLIGCMAVIGEATEAAAQSAVITLPDDELMVVLFLTADSQYLLSIRGPATFTVEGNKMYMAGQVIVNNLNKVSYSVHPYKFIEPKYEYDEEIGEWIEVPQYMAELGLEDITSDDLPKSQHIAKLVAVDSGKAKPAVVTRKFLGQTYTINCLVSQSAKDMYLAGDLAVGDYVIVSFIDEIPDTVEVNIAVVTDKIWESW